MNPWVKFPQATCLPDKCNCEFVQDALIRQPVAFWSSFAYIAVALILFKTLKNKNLDHHTWIGVCTLLGISSLLGHASFTRFAMAMDFASIILVLSFFPLYNLLRLLKRPNSQTFFILFLYYAILIVGIDQMEKWTKVSVCVLIFVFSMGDLVRELKGHFLKAKDLHLSIIILFLSFGLFLVDELHIYCEPHSFFQLHSVWHLGTAASLYFYGKWRLDSRNFNKTES